MLRTRLYGGQGPLVFVLHGGPGAPGHMAPVARGLQDAFRVVEPLQRRSGADELTVARHVEDLEEVVAHHAKGEPAAVLGSSWGAMLALAWAAAHPRGDRPLVLVGCGTFDAKARAHFHATLHAARAELPAPGEGADLEAIDRLYVVDESEGTLPGDELPIDWRGHEETWADMLRQQERGHFPAAFRAIEAPVLMLHGEQDPHPGALIRDGLRPHVPQLEYVAWERCGHYPWRERAARATFFGLLRAWMLDHLT